MKVAIIGSEGFVGGAMTRTFIEHDVETVQIDVKLPETMENYKRLTPEDVAFICVPTPYNPVTGTFGYHAIRHVVNRLAELDDRPTTCLRSTVTPDFFEADVQFAHHIDLHQPEFLRARYAYEDFNAPDIHVIGGHNNEHSVFVERLQTLYAACDIMPKELIRCTMEEAAALKLVHNVYRALRISFLNEMYVFAEKKLDGWEQFGEHVTTMFGARDFGGHYLQVPGPDGKFGFGGACFPKDLSAFIGYLKSSLIPCTTLDAARTVNARMRLHE